MKKLALRFVAAAALLMVLGGAFVQASPVSAQPSTSTITFHFRACPTGAVDVVAECHPNGIAGITAYAYNTVGFYEFTCISDANGNCDILIDAEGPWELGDDYYTDHLGEFRGAYCASADMAGEEPFLELPITSQHAGESYVCDVYYHDASLDGGETEMPETGVGSAVNGGATLAMVIGGIVMLGGLGVASRKRSFR